tara:strand:+ start:796 stop:1077 length:282 start_codon:yes stop_codon:yes gene_type:complete
MTDKELKKLGDNIAQSLIDKSTKAPEEVWKTENEMDHLVGELARCMTLNNIYEEREEYEKCAIMKLRVESLNEQLGIDDIEEEGEEGDDGDET